MEKIKTVFILFVLAMSFTPAKAQDDAIIRKGLLRTQLTLAPSYMFSDKQAYFYLHGNFEGYLNEHISLSGDTYISLGHFSSGNSTFDQNHSVLFGANWHFPKKNNDFYLGIQPGIAFTKLNAAANELSQTKMGVNPLFSVTAGYNYYFYKYFHFFLQTRLVTGKHSTDMRKGLTELRFSAGLGLNINAKKR